MRFVTFNEKWPGRFIAARKLNIGVIHLTWGHSLDSNLNTNFPEAERFLRDLKIAGPPGEYLPYWDQISYTRFLFDFWYYPW